MRSFPRARRRPQRRLTRAAGVAAVLAVLLSGSLTSVSDAKVSLSGEDHLRDKHKHVKGQISDAQKELAEASAGARRTALALDAARADLANSRDALTAARAQVEVARIKDQAAQHDLDAAVVKLATARADLAQGQRDVQAKRQDIAAMLVDDYQQGDPQLLNLAALLDAQTPADLTSQEQTGQVVVDNEVAAYDRLRAAEVLLTLREQDFSDAKDEMAVRRREAADLLTQRRESEQQAQSATEAYWGQVRSARDAKSAADEARAADAAKLKELKAEQARIEAMLRRRAAAAAAAAAAAGHKGPPEASGGYLSYPVNGPVTSPFGYRVHPIYGYYSLHDGTDFGASCGAPLYSAADGTVISSYWNTAYGNRMIIDNGFARGVGLATIYNHAVRYVVGVGDHVSRGQVIGYVGTTGWSTGCHLHFTVMVNGSPVDPMGWL